MVRIRKTEGESLEFKRCSGKCGAKLPEKLWQIISVFANTRGGSILLGVSDSGEIKNPTTRKLDVNWRSRWNLVLWRRLVRTGIAVMLLKNKFIGSLSDSIQAKRVAV
jgi:divergent AAA domain